MTKKILSVVGARPNFMKVAPLHRAFQSTGLFESRIVHTGQHYDEKMSDIFFRQLELPKPHIHLGIGSGSHAEQTGRVMIEFEKIVLDEKPDLVLVVGDVNSTLACSVVSAKCCIPLAHVEAGLRSHDRRMPEEVNRIVTDSLSDHLFVTEQSGIDNLEKEGVPAEKIHFVGNVMIDSLVRFRDKAATSTVVEDLKLNGNPFVLMTLHRPSNVDDPGTLNELLRMARSISEQAHLVFPMHPRTGKQLAAFNLLGELESMPNVTITNPLGYLEFLRLMELSKAVVTDSGGIQEETTFLGVPCLTLRENTERPVTITAGTNELLPFETGRVCGRLSEILNGQQVAGQIPPLWDGKAAERIADRIASVLGLHQPAGG